MGSTPTAGGLVVVGGSSGSLDALAILLRALPATWPLAVAVALHLHRHASTFLAESLDQVCALPVAEAEDKQPLRAGQVWIAPANYHLLVEADRTLALSVDPPVSFARPSIDVLFESAAEAYGPAAAAVLVTGANADGAAGAAAVKRAGGLVAVQDPASAAAAAMPRAALDATPVDAVADLAGLAAWLRALPERLIAPGSAHVRS